MSKRFKDVERPRIEERFDYADLVRRRLEDCGKAVVDPIIFQATVQALENLIPETDIDDKYIEDKKNSETLVRKWEYTTWRGRNQGTPESPVKHNDPEDWLHYDPKKPTYDISPIEWEYPVIDWNARFRAAFNLFVRLGVAVSRGAISA